MAWRAVRSVSGLIAAGALVLAPLCAAAAPLVAGLDVAGMDTQVAPGDDFFAYANGGWLKTAKIPADRPSWGPTEELTEKTNARLAEILRGQATASPGSEGRKAADAYAAFMDEARIEALGLAPLRPALDRIAAIADRKALARELGAAMRADVDPFNSTNFHTDRLLGLFVEQDLDAPDRYAPYLLQGGLGMPDREYYLSDKPEMAKIRGAYRDHLAKLLILTGVADANAEADRVLALETATARVHATRAQSEDVKAGDNHWPRARFARDAPGLDWDAYFNAAGLPDVAEFIVWQPDAVRGEAALIGGQPLSVWREYLTVREIDRSSGLLPRAFADERFAFYGRTLRGTPQQADRWKRAVAAVNAQMPDAAGKLYVAAWFPASAKAAAESMVQALKAAFAERIDALTWMAPATKAEARRKLATLEVGVGYPDRWIDYAGLAVDPGAALENARQAELFEYRRNVAKLGRPVDRREWSMPAQLVDAVNLPVRNALNFPAAVLQPPFFDPTAAPAVNFGITGATIGHEISHSFDDQGAQFDSRGALRNWWTASDYAHFRASGRALAAQYSAYRPFQDLAVNGEQTLSENIADLAGLAAAFDAWRRADPGQTGAGGYSGAQTFFTAYAQGWRETERDPYLRELIVTDGHAPARYRADTVRNLDPWYAAFGVKPGQALYLAPADRVRVW